MGGLSDRRAARLDPAEVVSAHSPILPRSRHLPNASTEGSRTRNLNKTGVRLWTDRHVHSVICGTDTPAREYYSTFQWPSGGSQQVQRGFRTRTVRELRTPLGARPDLYRPNPSAPSDFCRRLHRKFSTSIRSLAEESMAENRTIRPSGDALRPSETAPARSVIVVSRCDTKLKNRSRATA